ncbi:GlsB/YeaQ/YmgE family stress response membrane protein [candidate division KSB1 bacterium]|nr:GlsB/YeaQ/YmgE family stress response membrane protein [candidate division KSB1 bacterium]
MSILELLLLLLLAAICGSIGAALAGHSSRGCITSIVLGFIGALIGGYLSRQLGISDIFYIRSIPVIWSIVGAALFVAVINMLSGGKRR